MVHHDERPANGFVCGSFFAIGISFARIGRLREYQKQGAASAGLHRRPLQAKDSGLRKIILHFCNFIVGASIARPLRPCDTARPPGRAEPHPYNELREMRIIISTIS